MPVCLPARRHGQPIPARAGNRNRRSAARAAADARTTIASGPIGTTADIANAACQIGLTLLGGYAESYVMDLFQYTTLELHGTAQLADSNGNYNMDVLEEGVADANWIGADGRMSFMGVMDGSRLDDGNGEHPVRSRLTGLR